ncbi:MAG TPA: CBS domain-containing protein [Pseudolabrys sp.]|nr:CBS domain-containing protein [Pseudolabrys sp.]
MLARDVMTAGVISVTPETSVRDIAKTLVEHNISGVPVVDKGGRLVGIVSEGDLMRRPESKTEHRRSWWLKLLVTHDQEVAEYIKTHGQHAADVMSRPVITVAEDATLENVADTLQKHRVKRAPVMRGEKVVGIVARADLLHGLIARQAGQAPSTDDNKVKAALERELKSAGVDTRFLSTIVSGGVVHIWGLVMSAEDREAVRIAAEAAGVKKMRLNVDVIPRSFSAE